MIRRIRVEKNELPKEHPLPLRVASLETLDRRIALYDIQQRLACLALNDLRHAPRSILIFEE